MRLKEIVLALEWSKNDSVLQDIFKWIEDEIQKSGMNVTVNQLQLCLNVVKGFAVHLNFLLLLQM